MGEQPEHATRADRRIEPLPARRAPLSVERMYSTAEYALIARGFSPVVMEDKWFIFVEDNRLYAHRSWTGIAIFEARFEPRGDGYALVEAWVNRDPEQYESTDDACDAALLMFLIDRLLLGYQPPLPTGKGDSEETGAVRMWSLLGHCRARDEPVDWPQVVKLGPPLPERAPPPSGS